MILAALFLSLIAIIPAARDMLLSMRNDVKEWLPAGFQETVDLIWFAERFGSDEILVISWPGCTLEDLRLPRMAEELKKVTARSVAAEGGNTLGIRHEFASAAAPADQPLFKRIFHGSSVAAQLSDVLGVDKETMSDSHVEMLEQTIRDRMSGWLLGPDDKTTCAVALVSKTGEDYRHAAVEAVYQEARRLKIPRSELRVGGSTIDSVSIDNASFENLPQMIGLAVFLGLTVAWFALRRLDLVLAILGTALYCWLVALAIMHWSGQTMNSILIVAPVLIYVLSVSGSIHLVNYYLDSCHRGKQDAAIGHMVVDSFAPCVLAALTTAIGVGSLAMSELVPIRNFGIYAAINTIVSLILFYLLLPSALTFFHARRPPLTEEQLSPEQRVALRQGLIERFLHGWARFVIRAQVFIVLCAMLVLGFCTLGVLQIQTAVKMKALFPEHAEVIQNYTWLENKLGPLVPVEIVLRFPENGTSNASQRLRLTAEVQHTLAAIPGVGGTMSTATFAPEVPTGGGIRAVIARSRMNSALERRHEQIRSSGFLAVADGEELWRVSARVPAMSDEDYGEYLAKIRAGVEAVLTRDDLPANAESSFVICGGVPLFSSASKALLSDLESSFFSAFILIGLAMFILVALAMNQVIPASKKLRWWTILWRGALGSILAMIPNVFPVLLIFGIMGAMGVKIDIGAMMTASIALGIAVDDTLHFLTWFQRAMVQKEDRRRAVLKSFRHCARAMVQTSLVCSLGLLAFSFSEFIPTSRFAWLMCALLFSALFGDMVVLPALLVSSLGRVFKGAQA